MNAFNCKKCKKYIDGKCIEEHPAIVYHDRGKYQYAQCNSQERIADDAVAMKNDATGCKHSRLKLMCQHAKMERCQECGKLVCSRCHYVAESATSEVMP